MRSLSAVVGALVFMSGCLVTRGEIRQVEERRVETEAVRIQQDEARLALEEQMASLRGRVEVLEHQKEVGKQEQDERLRQMSIQMEDYQRRLSLLQQTIEKLEQQLASVAAAETPPAAPPKPLGPFEQGETHFRNKEWSKAVIAFNKYREENPKGKLWPEATYKIGVAFQELGMKDDAKIFYEEVIFKAPNSNEAKKARVRLKSLK